MKWLLDTNAFSEPGRPQPDPGFADWFDQTDENDMVLSVVTIGEMDRGLALMADGARKLRLEAINRGALQAFGGHILPIDLRTARLWGDLSARLKTSGLNFGVPDEMIAATALRHGLTVVSRDRRPFEAGGCRILSPWSD